MKDGGTFVRLTLEPKLMDRQQSKVALGGDLMSAKASQLLHECHGIPVDPHAASSATPRKVAAAAVGTDSEEEREVQRDIKASQRHEAARMVEAKAAKSVRSRDKGKNVVPENQRRSHLCLPRLLGKSSSVPVWWLRLLGYPGSLKLTAANVRESHK
ncbi:hypothetical protein R1sor_023910 [Riccia sorocarpa]|uniref:Uncharacterized protein n=1 Tax=Riccia sorocarpa TaxID=122646 RepID=A0ABD3GRB3_9MARC